MLSSREISINEQKLKFPVKPIYYGLLLLGIMLRLIPYFLNHSLFLDEASIALNITDRTFTGLLHPLDYMQIAPVLFLFIEKVNIIVFGNSEYSLRLFPLLCGLLSLPLVYRFTKAISGNVIAALVSLFLFATSPVLIDYSNQVKQYECDVFCVLCLITLVFDSTFYNESKKYIMLAVAGSVFIFLSNIAILVLFTIGVYYLFKYRLTILKMRFLLAAFTCWVISFLLYYCLFINNNPVRANMLGIWQNEFMPFNILSAQFWVWLYENFLSLFKFYSLPFIAVFILSAIVFTVKKRRLFLYFLLFPLAVHFILSGFKIYPFQTRLILYLIVFITPALAIGLVELVQLFSNRITIYPVVILLMVLVYSIIAQLVNNHYPFYKEEIKRSIAFINSNKSTGQKVYVYYGAERAVNYYLRINRVPFKNDLIWGTEDWAGANPNISFNTVNKLSGEVWLLFSHVNYNDEDYTIKHLTESNDIVLRTFKTTGSSAYLVKINPAR